MSTQSTHQHHRTSHIFFFVVFFSLVSDSKKFVSHFSETPKSVWPPVSEATPITHCPPPARTASGSWSARLTLRMNFFHRRRERKKTWRNFAFHTNEEKFQLKFASAARLAIRELNEFRYFFPQPRLARGSQNDTLDGGVRAICVITRDPVSVLVGTLTKKRRTSFRRERNVDDG